MVETFEDLKRKIREDKEKRAKEKLAQHERENFEEYQAAFKYPTYKIQRRDFIKKFAGAICGATVIGGPIIISNILSKSKLEQKAESMINLGFRELPRINGFITLKEFSSDLEDYYPKEYARRTAVALVNTSDSKRHSKEYNIIVHTPLSPEDIKISISENKKVNPNNPKNVEPNYLHLVKHRRELEIYWDTTKFPATRYLKDKEFLFTKKVNFTDSFNHKKALELYETISAMTSPLFTGNRKSYVSQYKTK